MSENHSFNREKVLGVAAHTKKIHTKKAFRLNRKLRLQRVFQIRKEVNYLQKTVKKNNCLSECRKYCVRTRVSCNLVYPILIPQSTKVLFMQMMQRGKLLIFHLVVASNQMAFTYGMSRFSHFKTRLFPFRQCVWFPFFGFQHVSFYAFTSS